MWLKSLREISSVNARKSTTKMVVISNIKGPKNQNRAADRRMPSGQAYAATTHHARVRLSAQKTHQG
jgi:hypothetical protein